MATKTQKNLHGVETVQASKTFIENSLTQVYTKSVEVA